MAYEQILKYRRQVLFVHQMNKNFPGYDFSVHGTADSTFTFRSPNTTDNDFPGNLF